MVAVSSSNRHYADAITREEGALRLCYGGLRGPEAGSSELS